MASYPPDDSIINVDVVEWHDRFLIAVDEYGLPYIHWFDDDARWSNVWENRMRQSGLSLRIRVGRKDGPRGRKCFVIDLAFPVAVQKSEPITRSPLDLFKAANNDLDKTLESLGKTMDSIDRHAPKSKRKRSPMGKVTYAPELTIRLWHAADTLGVGLAEVSELCITEGRTPEALIASRGK